MKKRYRSLVVSLVVLEIIFGCYVSWKYLIDNADYQYLRVVEAKDILSAES